MIRKVNLLPVTCNSKEIISLECFQALGYVQLDYVI